MTMMMQALLPGAEPAWRDARAWPAVLDAPAANSATAAGAATAASTASTAPARLPTPWLRLMLDAIDYGAGLLLPDATLAYANAALQARLARGDSLRLDTARRLVCTDAAGQQRLTEARHDACVRGLRRLVTLGRPGPVLALVGLMGTSGPGDSLDGVAQPCLLLAQRQAPCERLSLAMFARQHALTQAETRVLQGLADGDSPEAISLQLGVRITTVRTHIVHLRAKTGAASLRELMQCLATLPPVVSALRAAAAPLA